MENEKWLIIGTDARLKSLAKKLSNGDRTVYYKSETTWSEELNLTAFNFQPNHVVLPIHPLPIEVAVVLGLSNAKIFAGKLNEEWKEILKNHDIHYYLQDESFIWKNAQLTAEGFISFFHNTKQAIYGKKFIITGFGRVSKLLAHVLKSIGGEVCIAVRAHVQLNEAKAFQYEAVYLDNVSKVKGDYFINTIPAKWIDEKFNSDIEMPIYDLASSPGCLQDNVERSNYELLPALPGKYFPQDAAHVLYESIVGQIRGREEC
ncbi:dipicolinate synthase subunit A [Ureibacillus sp. MALMAid1270]|uniref:dipicolinate synthase subunit A n=1 Tax=Ureibacillus sp. MALMAid1270 TaxID=3411629 RepID=UPI003BA83CBB